MYGYIGLALLTVSGLLFGFDRASMMKKRIRTLEGLGALLDYMAGRIEHFSVPLDLIFSTFENKTLLKTGFLKRLRTVGFSEAVRTDEFLEARERAVLLSFSEALGSHGAEEEAQNCRACKEEIRMIHDDALREYPGKARLWRTLPLLGGLSVLLLLL